MSFFRLPVDVVCSGHCLLSFFKALGPRPRLRFGDIETRGSQGFPCEGNHDDGRAIGDIPVVLQLGH